VRRRGRQIAMPVPTTSGDASPAVARILGRLRRGLAWLTETDAGLAVEDRPDPGLTRRFLAALDAWDATENALRELYHYQGCILGPGQSCPDDAPVRCRHCAGTAGPIQHHGLEK
jgi:hypothetical protein